MNLNSLKIDLKIFKIDTNVKELRDKSSAEIINHIKENHLKKLRHKFKDLDIKVLNPNITEHKEGDFKFWSYCFRQPQEKFYWKIFLPNELTEKQDFNIVEFSYVLFILYKGNIYCIISGSGMNVIKKYIHPTFGIETYQKIAEPTEDNIIELNVRSIANNISSKRETFNLNQTISETLNYSDVPTKIKLKVREALKQNEFKDYKLDKNLAIMEVGSYFYLRKKIDFDQLMQLIIDLHSINKNLPLKQLTLFSKINDINIIENLDKDLLNKVIDDIQSYANNESKFKAQNDVIELVHPSKLERFYECEEFLIKYKFSRGKRDLTVTNRENLYDHATKYIYDHLDNIDDRFEITKHIFKLSVTGLIDKKEKTFADFFSHVTAEREYQSQKYFRIDSHWYILEDKFLDVMNDDAKTYYRKYELKANILNEWLPNDDEDTYNKSHADMDDYYILDKVIKDNIELCDVLTLQGNKAYFIHVKNGFNTKMRDLYIQVILAAKRLSNDLKNNSGVSYLKKTLQMYNNRNTKKIDILDFIDKIKNKEITICFVMAFKNNHHKNYDVIERIDKCSSNIAKYSLVQVVKEMQEFEYEINLIDISDISST